MTDKTQAQAQQEDQAGEIAAGCAAGRKAVDATGYGHFVSDAMVKQIVTEVVKAVDDYRAGTTI